MLVAAWLAPRREKIDQRDMALQRVELQTGVTAGQSGQGELRCRFVDHRRRQDLRIIARLQREDEIGRDRDEERDR
jgi:hypothetical protein